MIDPQCVENIHQLRPGARICRSALCAGLQPQIDRYCHDTQRAPCQPIPVYDPELEGPGDDGMCFCCCGGCGPGTVVEVAEGEYEEIPALRPGDTVMAAGPEGGARPARVTGVTEHRVPAGGARTVRFWYDPADPEPRALTVPEDALFALHGGALAPARALEAGAALLRDDGGRATVAAVETADGPATLHTLRLGPFDGASLEGHLLGLEGVRVADDSVVEGRAAAGGRRAPAAAAHG